MKNPTDKERLDWMERHASILGISPDRRMPTFRFDNSRLRKECTDIRARIDAEILKTPGGVAY